MSQVDRRQQEQSKVTLLVMTGLMTALVAVAIIVLPIPIPGTTGYINLGDGVIFLSVFVLGWRHGAFAGGVGAGMADILLGSAIWSPWTLVIKAGMAMLLGFFLARGHANPSKKGWTILGMAVAVLWMVGGYYIAEGVIYGNWMAPLIGVPWNFLQGGVALVLACALSAALEKTSARNYFANKI